MSTIENQLVTVTVNGRTYERAVEPRKALSDFLREDLELTGTHVACEHGFCGVCNNLLDGQTVRSCLLFAVQVDGASIETVESLAAPDGTLNALQQAFSDNAGLQCGYRHRAAVIIHRHHGEEAAVDMAFLLAADVLCNHLDADFHGRFSGVVDAGEKRNQLAHMHGLAKHDLVYAHRHHIPGGVAAGTGVGHLVQELQQCAPVHIAGKVGHIGRHQDGHAEFVGGCFHGLDSSQVVE